MKEKKNTPALSDLEKLKMENELKKLKLAAERGASFHTSPESDLPPEVESQWLDNIRRFEEAYENVKQVTLYDFIGRPAFKPVDQVTNEELKNELARISDVLVRHSISVDTICAVEDRELYRFITEELFRHDTDDVRLPGMVQHYTYEEFHPNHEHDIESHCRRLIESLMDKERKFNPEYLPVGKETMFRGEALDQDALRRKMEDFRSCFEALKLFRMEPVSIEFEGDTGKAVFDIRYSAVADGSREQRVFSGKAEFGMRKVYDCWDVVSIEVPGCK